MSFPKQIHLNFRLKCKISCHVMITLNFTNKPSTKALFTYPIQINYRKDLASNHIYTINLIFKIRPLLTQFKHMMHKINAVLLCRHLGCHRPGSPPARWGRILGAFRQLVSRRPASSGWAHWPESLGLLICGVKHFVFLFTWPRPPLSTAFQHSPPYLLLLAAAPSSALLLVALFVV